jgi:monoamine oxidase
MRDEETGGVLDLAVVGGGVAGTYVAYRLALGRPDWSIAVFERNDRVGGRLLSLRFPGVVSRRAELGGMRFRSSQPLVSGVVRELQLQTAPFLTVHDDNRFFLRGGRWRHGNPRDAAKVYRLNHRERNLSPAEVLVVGFERIVPGASRLTDDEWLVVKRDLSYLGRPLRDWTLHDALATVLSEEAHRYVVDGFGYSTLLRDRSAADAIPWVLIETRPEAENMTLADGMEQLPRELAARFQASGGTVHLGHVLLRLERDGRLLRLEFDRSGTVLTRRVVLAMPRRALEAVSERTPLLAGPEMGALLRSVTAHSAAKLALAYERPWWRDDGMAGRRAVSDLPLSKTYYFDAPEPGAPDTSALMLASYCDGPSRDTWCALTDHHRFPPDAGPTDATQRWERYEASCGQVEEAQRQLRELHAIPSIPEPVASAFVDWGADPFGAAWHVWNPGVRSWEVTAQLRRPLPDLDLFICGEAYSFSQGWVEGALETAQAVVEELSGRTTPVN